MDPISIICSQKVWMDSTIAFFTLLSALFFIYGLKHNIDWMYIFSGLSSGLAVNTKYTGILITFIIVLFCLFYRKDIFKNKKFQISLVLPALMLTPWFYWNYKAYGIASIFNHSELRTVYTRFITHLPMIIFMVILTALFIFLLNRFKKDRPPDSKLSELKDNKNFIGYFSILVTVALFVLIIPNQFIHSLQFNYLPTHTWRQGSFSGEPSSFYFGRLLEFSPVYIFSFLAIFRFDPNDDGRTPFIRLCAMVILLFFIFWGNFQSRYILASLPFLIILAVQFGVNIYEKASRSGNAFLCMGGRISLKLIFVYIIVKSYYLNIMVSYPHDFCYF